MKAIGNMICEMAKGLKGILIIIRILVSLNMARHMEKVYILGQMVKSMMENGIRDLNKEMAYGKEYRMILI